MFSSEQSEGYVDGNVGTIRKEVELVLHGFLFFFFCFILEAKRDRFVIWVANEELMPKSYGKVL